MIIVVLLALISFSYVKCQHVILLQLIWLRLFYIEIHNVFFFFFFYTRILYKLF